MLTTVKLRYRSQSLWITGRVLKTGVIVVALSSVKHGVAVAALPAEMDDAVASVDQTVAARWLDVEFALVVGTMVVVEAGVAAVYVVELVVVVALRVVAVASDNVGPVLVVVCVVVAALSRNQQSDKSYHLCLVSSL